MRGILVVALLVVQACTAQAWDYAEDEDALDDRAIATLGEADRTGGFGLAIKCWKGGETQLRLLTMLPYGDGSRWSVAATADFRVDKRQAHKLLFATMEMNGRVSLVTYAPPADFANSDVAIVLRELAEAKQRVVIGFGTQIVHFTASKAAAAVVKLAARCGLDLAKPADDDDAPQTSFTPVDKR